MANESIKQEIKVHPWRRFFARYLDCFVLSLFGGFVLGATTPGITDILSNNQYSTIINILLSGLIASLLTPFFLALFGTTPAKYLFGIRIHDGESNNLSLLKAFKREFFVYIKGLALCVPLASFFTMTASHSRLKKHGITSWDEKLKCVVEYRENNRTQKILNVTGVLIYFILVTIINLPEKSHTAVVKDSNHKSEIQTKTKENKTSALSHLNEAVEIEEAKKNGYIGRNEYIEKMSNCADNGNIYCSAILGDFFYDENSYALAYKYLLNSTQAKFGQKIIEYELGYLLSLGYGVKKDTEKAIPHFEKSARLGYSEAAYALGVIYGNKAMVLLEKNPSDLNGELNLKKSYAWERVAKAMGKDTSVNLNTQIQDINVAIERKKSLLIARSALDDANELTSKICLSIKQCRGL